MRPTVESIAGIKSAIDEHLGTDPSGVIIGYLYGHRCRVCDTYYKRVYDLRMHSTAHTNVFPYMCEYCGSTFKRKVHLAAHHYAHSY